MREVRVYSAGVFCCSVCAPAEMPRDEVQRSTNRVHPCGTSQGWVVSKDTHFASGEENGCECECDGEKTRHWLLDA